MTRLPMLTARKLVAALKRAGFEEVKWHGSHLYLANQAKNKITCIPMHNGDLGRDLVRAILHQAGLAQDDFIKLLQEKNGLIGPFFVLTFWSGGKLSLPIHQSYHLTILTRITKRMTTIEYDSIPINLCLIVWGLFGRNFKSFHCLDGRQETG